MIDKKIEEAAKEASIRWLSRVFINKKIVYVRIAKCASSSMNSIIKKYDNFGMIGMQVVKDKYPLPRPLILKRSGKTCREGEFRVCWKIKLALKGDWNNFKKYTIVRNPWDRFISSCFFLNKKPGMQFTFIDFLNMMEKNTDEFTFNRRLHLCSQLDVISDADNNLLVDKVIRFENLQAEFCEFLKQEGENPMPTPMPNLNKTTHDFYANYYDKETEERVYNLYRDDIDFFGYKFGL